MDEITTVIRAATEISLFTVGEVMITPAGVLRALVILTLAWWVSKLSRRSLARVSERRPNLNASSVYTIGRLSHYFIMTIGMVASVSSLGIDLNKFALFASALGVGVGFGLQTLISNFVAGLMLLFDRTLKIGDFVDLESGVTGEVKEISIRSTIVTTNDNVDVVVPNAEFVNGRVTNWTMRDAVRRIRVPFGVSYLADKELVRKVVVEAARSVPHTLITPGREPQVWLVEFGDSSLNFELAVWLEPRAVKSPTRVQGDYLWAIHTALQDANIEIPFPQRDLHIRNWHGPDGPSAQEK
ncbi:MAG: mechanosensitive ion channel family protein [Oceanococcus sp.]